MFRLPCVACVRRAHTFLHARPRVRSSARHSLRPLDREGDVDRIARAKTSRENEDVCSQFVAYEPTGRANVRPMTGSAIPGTTVPACRSAHAGYDTERTFDSVAAIRNRASGAIQPQPRARFRPRRGCGHSSWQGRARDHSARSNQPMARHPGTAQRRSTR